MNILTRYIVKEVLKGSFLALLLLVTLFNLFTLSDELKDLGKGSYQLPEIFTYLALSTPAAFYDLVPSGALIGSIFVLGAMANNSEVIAMRASGVSVLAIIRSVMLAGVFLVIVSVAIGEFIAPKAERAAHLLKTTAQNNRVIMQAKYGIWLREGNSFINIRQMPGKSRLDDVSLYQLDAQHHLTEVKHAQTANFLGNNQWQLQNSQTTLLSTNSVSASQADNENWQTSIAPDLLNIVVVTATNLSSYDLAKYIVFLKSNNQKSQTFEAAFWARVLNPFVTFVMLLVSTPFVIGIKRGTSIGGRLIIGIVIGLSFNILDQIISHLGIVYNLNPLLMALLPSSLVLMAALYAINRLRA
jgi:lipopolysaccharide export system permease protein